MYTARDAQQADSAARLIINQAPHNNKSEKSQTALREWNFLEKISRAASERVSREAHALKSLRAYRVSVCVVCKVELSAASGVVVGSWVIPGVTLLASTRRRFSMWAKILIFIPMHVRFQQHSWAIKLVLLPFYLKSTFSSENNKVWIVPNKFNCVFPCYKNQWVAILLST